MKRLTRWIPVLVLGTALLSTGACGKSESDASTEGEAAVSDAPVADESDAADEAATAKADNDPAAEGDTPALAKPETEETAEDKAAEAKLKAMGPEEEEAVKKRCGDAFDNTVNIMQVAGAPANIAAQMRQQRDKTVASCLEQAKIDPSGSRMIDCMLAARLPVDIQTCTRKFGNIKPLKAPAGVGAGHGGH